MRCGWPRAGSGRRPSSGSSPVATGHPRPRTTKVTTEQPQHRHSRYRSGYTVRTDRWRYSEYVNLIDGDTQVHSSVMITSVTTDNTVQGPQNTHHGEETQAPDWANPEDWGELYDLANDPEETVNLYRLQEFHDVKISLRKILYAGWTDHNF